MVRAIAQNGREYRDKHLAAHLIPIGLRLIEQYAGLQSAKAAKSMQVPDFGERLLEYCYSPLDNFTDFRADANHGH